MSAIHPTAVVDGNARIGRDVEIGACSVVGPNVTVGDRVRIMPHVFIDGWTTIGAGCAIFPFASIGTQTQDLKYAGGKTFVEIGERTTLREYVSVNSGTAEGETTRIGSDCHIMAYCHVAHKCEIGNGVIMSNCSQLAGHVVVEDYATFGGMVGVHQFVRIGRMSFIGGFTRIAQDVPPFFIVEGNPAAVHGINSVGLRRREVPAAVREILKEAYRLLCRENLSTSQAIERIRRELKPCSEVEHLIRFIESSGRGIIK